MITKFASLYYNGNDCFSVKNTKGFNKAILHLTAPEGCTVSYLYIQKSIDSTAPSIGIKNIFENKVFVGSTITPSTGGHTYIIDISGSTSIQIKVRDDAETKVPVTNVSLCLMQVPVDEYETDATTMLKSGTKVSVNVQEYNSAYIMLHVPENFNSIIRPYVTYDGTEPNYSSKLFGLYYGGVKLIDQETRFKSGDYVLYAEFNGETNFMMTTTNGTFDILLTKGISEIKTNKTTLNTASPFTLDSSTCNSLKITVVNGENGAVRLLNQDNSNIPLYVSGVKSVTGWRMNTGDVIYADCRGCTKVTFSKGCNIIVEQSDNIVSDEFLESGTVCKDSPYYVVEQGKQVDFTISKINANSFRVLLQGSNDNFVNTTDIGILNVDTNKYATSITISNRNNAKLYANIEGYKNVRLAFTFSDVTHKAVVTSQVHQDYLEGRVIGNIGNGVSSNLLTGYKYLKFRFLKEGYINGLLNTATIDECNVSLDIRNNGEKCYDLLKFFDRGMNLLGYNFIASGILLGTPSDGGFIVTINSAFSNKVSIEFRIATISEASKRILPYELSCYVNPPAAEPCLTKIRERADYTIYELPSPEQNNRDVLNEDVLEWSDNSLTFWHCGYLGVRYDIPFNVSNVAHFVDGETIKFAYLLPYYRGDRVGRLYYPSRIVVFTNTRVFHNYPERENSNMTDLFRFDESIIYNKYKWQPVNDISKVNDFRKYFPVLKDYDYDQFKYRVATTGYYKVEVNTDDELPSGVEPIENAIPIQETGKYDSTAIGDITLPDIYNRVVTYYKSNGDDTYTSWKITTLDPYGNGGLPDSSLQDALTKTDGIWNRIKYSSMTKCQKYCAFGNYNGMHLEPFVMLTNDGGKRWYVRAYFAVTDFYYNQGPGSGIDLKPITDVAGAYITNSLRMCRKRFNIPTAEIKEPATPFIIDDNDKSLVTGFSVNDNGDCVVTLADDVDYDGHFPIVYFENVNANSEWNYICNDSVTASSGGNGIFFRVSKVSANQYILYGDTGNPNEGDMVCRHIHAVNAVECGVLISTGESYGVNPANWFEGGFLYVIKQTENNGGSAINVNYNNTELDVVTRLTSSPLGVNRASGAFLFSDNADPTLLYVSDEAFTVKENHKRYAALPSGRTQMLPLTPGGIYVGKLSDIDEQAKFKCVCETKGTVVGLTENKGHFAADGHENAICLSKNGFDWTIEEDTRSYVNGADNKGNIYFGNKVAVFK